MVFPLINSETPWKCCSKDCLSSLLRFLIVSVISVFCESCENPYGNFQEISQRCQEPGRLEPRARNETLSSKSFSRRWNVSTSACELQSVAPTIWNKSTWKIPESPYWICVINRRVNSQGLTPKLGSKQKRWTHFSVSSQDLQRVSYFRY